MQSPVRAIIYSFLLYFSWLAAILILYMLLPKDIAVSAFFVTVKTVMLAGFTLYFILRYMKSVGNGSFNLKEGLLVGLLWLVIGLISDTIHYSLMGSFELGAFLLLVAPAYLVIPLIVVSLMTFLQAKKKK